MRPIDTIPLGSSRGGCTACGEVFSTTANFDRHRVFGCGHDRRHRDECYDTRRCLTPGEMGSVGLELKPNGVWAGLGSEQGIGSPAYASESIGGES